MRVIIAPEARIELRDIRRWYAREAGLQVARRFVEEFRRVRSAVGSDPLRWPQAEPGVHGLPFADRFPYTMIYIVRGTTVIVVAVMHQHRDPGYWQSRISRDP
jgi:plasmid stabilization system protein ParE